MSDEQKILMEIAKLQIKLESLARQRHVIEQELQKLEHKLKVIRKTV